MPANTILIFIIVLLIRYNYVHVKVHVCTFCFFFASVHVETSLLVQSLVLNISACNVLSLAFC